MSAHILRGGRVIDPTTGEEGVRDVGFINGQLAPAHALESAEARDVSDCWVLPAFTDLRCVLRTTEDISDAIAGGYGRVVADPSSTRSLNARGLEVLFAADLTRGTELAERVPDAPCASSGFAPVATMGLLRRALQHAEGKRVMLHAEDLSLSAGAVLGEGPMALKLGLPSSPPDAEVAAVAAALSVLENTGGALHFSHLTCRGSVEKVAQAKRTGLAVTADVAIAHLKWDESKAHDFSLEGRVHPPLRSQIDVEALRRAVVDGTLDAVASDHRRRTYLEQEHPFEQAAWGNASLRNVFSDLLALEISPARAAALLTLGPATVLGSKPNGFIAGQPADLVVYDPRLRRTRFTVTRGVFR